MLAWSSAMGEKSVLDPALRPMVTTALAQPVLLGKWPQPLRKQWFADRKAQMLVELAFVLKLGFGLAIVAFVTDWLIVRDLAWTALAVRVGTIGPVTVVGLWAARSGRVAIANIATTIALSIFGAVAMWVAAHGTPADIARYSMAIVVTMLAALFVLPMSIAHKLRVALVFFLASSLAAFFPEPIPPELLIHHFAAGAIAGIGGLLLAIRNWHMESRSFLLSLQLRFDREDLEQSNALLRELSESDPLTGLSNRRSLERVFEDEYIDRAGGATALLMVDVDHFKRFNDRFGHQIGDSCLVEVARELERCIEHHGGHIARFGGEEFIAILHEQGGRDAEAIAEEMREAVASLTIETGQRKPCAVNISIGMARGRGGQSMGQLIARADEALYRAKQNGRNRVEVAYAAMDELVG